MEEHVLALIWHRLIVLETLYSHVGIHEVLAVSEMFLGDASPVVFQWLRPRLSATSINPHQLLPRINSPQAWVHDVNY